VGFEPTIPVFEREKTVDALDHAVTVTGAICCHLPIIKQKHGYLESTRTYKEADGCKDFHLYRLAQKIGPFSVWSTQKG
jgi:hypothetical protein